MAKTTLDKSPFYRKLRSVMLLEIVFVFILYIILLTSINRLLIEQNNVTNQLVARMEMASDVQTLERLMLQYVTHERGYRLTGDEREFAKLITTQEEFILLLLDMQQQLDRANETTAQLIAQERLVAKELQKNQKEVVAILRALLKREISPTVATDISQYPELAAATTAILEAQLFDIEEKTLGHVATWRSLIQGDVNRLQEDLLFFQQLRVAALATQAILVILSMAILTYTYVIPAFERILRKVVRQNEELKQMDRLKTEFLSIASHQLRSPLSALKWNLTLLKQRERQNYSDKQKSLLQQSYANMETMIQLVLNLLNVTRIEQGRLRFHPEQVDVVPIITTAIANVRGAAQERAITITTEFPKKSMILFIDPLLFRQIMQNLLDNAIAYNRASGSIKIGAKQQGSVWTITVADSGYGMSSADQKRLFSKFFRSAEAMKMRPDGSGLGLYFVKKIIERHHGKIEVKSKLNKGTTFILTFPTPKIHPRHLEEQSDERSRQAGNARDFSRRSK